jgi:hypothetical protein
MMSPKALQALVEEIEIEGLVDSTDPPSDGGLCALACCHVGQLLGSDALDSVAGANRERLTAAAIITLVQEIWEPIARL